MAKMKHHDFGIVNKRIFLAVTVDEPLQASLEASKSTGLIYDFRLDGDALTLWRPWIEGQTFDEFFHDSSELPRRERIEYAGEMFRRTVDKLETMEGGHGALHPRNIIFPRTGGIELVDATFNFVRLDPRSVKDKLWLWTGITGRSSFSGPCVPKGWDVEKWDRVSLLRTATLLAQGAFSWAKTPTTEEVAELCEGWTKEFSSGADFVIDIEEAAKLIPKIIRAEFGLPSFPLEEELETLRARQGNDCMLSERDEKSLHRRGAAQGLPVEEFNRRLSEWANRTGFQKEQELRHLAREFLAAGLDQESKELATARACSIAEGAFTHYGVGPEQAANFIEELLVEAAWIDGRKAMIKFQQYLASLRDDVPDEEFAMGFAKAHSYPPAVARRLVELETERRLLELAN